MKILTNFGESVQHTPGGLFWNLNTRIFPAPGGDSGTWILVACLHLRPQLVSAFAHVGRVCAGKIFSLSLMSTKRHSPRHLVEIRTVCILAPVLSMVASHLAHSWNIYNCIYLYELVLACKTCDDQSYCVQFPCHRLRGPCTWTPSWCLYGTYNEHTIS